MAVDPGNTQPHLLHTGVMTEIVLLPAVSTPRIPLLSDIADQVQRRGADAALAHLRRERPALRDGRYNDTVAVFTVWAIDRLLAGGLTSTAVLWHPLLHEDSVLAWWDAATLDSDRAADHFVPSTLALPGEPAPGEPTPTPPRSHLAAA